MMFNIFQIGFKCLLLVLFLGITSHKAHAASVLHYVRVHADRYPDVARAYLNALEKSNNPDVMIELANFYLYPTSFYNIEKANMLFQNAAQRNDPRGYEGLADSYLSAQGFAKNTVLSRIFYEKAAQLHYGPAQFNLAILYRDGVGGEMSHKKACYWIQMASRNQTLEFLQEDAQKIFEQLKCQ